MQKHDKTYGLNKDVKYKRTLEPFQILKKY
jgi:hypothetical protein